MRRRALKIKAVTYKGGKCEECGYSKCVSAMDFHHRNPNQKEYKLSSGRIKSWERMRIELDKCTLLCCRCHREEHENIFAAKLAEHEAIIALKKRQKPILVKCAYCKVDVLRVPSRIKNILYCNSKCAQLGATKAHWPNDKILAKLVWKKPMTIIAAELGVSDKAVKKRCTRLRIQTPNPGYWATQSSL